MTIQPVGSITAFAGKIGVKPAYDGCPKGWLPCDGEAIPAGSQYEKLRKLVGQNTPNLMGYFLRGLDTAGHVDPTPTRAVLDRQDDSIGPHTHGYSRGYIGSAGLSGAGSPNVLAYIDHPQTDSQTPAGPETRPKNKAVNFIIKATDEG